MFTFGGAAAVGRKWVYRRNNDDDDVPVFSDGGSYCYSIVYRPLSFNHYRSRRLHLHSINHMPQRQVVFRSEIIIDT
jgi:hypothetical protein